MKKNLIGACMLALSLVAVLSLMGCPGPTPSSSSTTTSSSSVGGICPSVAVPAGKILLAFDLSGVSFSPTAFGVVPFVVGEMTNIAGATAANWDTCRLSGGIKADGTGSQVLTLADGLYYILLTLPADGLDYSYNFKAANYATNDWANVTNNFWNTIGAQNTGVANDLLKVSNSLITAGVTPAGKTNNLLNGTKTNGMTISADGKRIVYDVAALGDWSVDVPGVTTGIVTLTLVCTNIPAVSPNQGDGSGLSKPAQFWAPLLNAITTNTNNPSAGIVSNGTKITVTGNAGFLATNGTTTWAPGAGVIATVDTNAKTATVNITIAAGAARSYQFKFCDSFGWNWGEQANNNAGVLPASGVFTQKCNFLN